MMFIMVIVNLSPINNKAYSPQVRIFLAIYFFLKWMLWDFFYEDWFLWRVGGMEMILIMVIVNARFYKTQV